MSLQKFGQICICFILITITTAASAFCVDVYLKEFTEYSKDILYLSDIISIKNADQTVRAALLSLPLQLTAKRIHILSANSIRKIIEKQYSGPLIIIGKSTICVPISTVPEYSTWFVKEFLTYLANHDYNSQGRLEVEIIKIPLIDFQTQVTELQFSLLSFKTSNGYLAGKIDIYASSLHEINSFSETISLFLHRYVNVAVPIRPLQQGERLLKSNLLFVEKDISEIEENILVEGMSHDHYITQVFLNTAETIPLAKLKLEFVIRKGDHIDIIFLSGNIKISTKGRAMQSGYIGAEVLVQPFNITKKFFGTISNSKEVVIELE